ncbi:MAG: type II methionyl aminopeptidase [Methanolinea sp.]|nr:type II methionyl aminopeptidase [Methanolinea sp.]
MEDGELDLYIEAGKIARAVLSKGAAEIREGVRILDLVERVESMVLDAGAGLAFPLNVSRNEDAAHDTASPGDERVFVKGDVVKIDLGVHIEGCIADCATTVDLGDNSPLVLASRRGLERALSLVRPGVTTGELGAAIQQEIESMGFCPVINLTGHGLDRFQIHTPPTIPNVRLHGGAVIREGMVFAIEPFASSGTGQVSEKPRTEIYQQVSLKPVRLPAARKVLDEIRPRRGLPFSRRWLEDSRREIALRVLMREGLIRSYPVLSDKPGSLVSQAEHTLVVTADGCIVTTR